LMRMQILAINMMRIHADPDVDPDPKHCSNVTRVFIPAIVLRR
jgi:hypothetical protein